MKFKHLILTPTFLLISNLVILAENPCNVMTPRTADEKWGIGAYQWVDNSSVDLYNDNNGEFMGKLERSTTYGTRVKLTTGKVISVNSNDQEWVGHYQHAYLKVDACSNSDFVKVLWHTFEEQDVYVSKKALDEISRGFFDYRTIFYDYSVGEKRIERNKIGTGNYNIGVNLEDNCLNLRLYPELGAQVLHCMPANEYYKDKGYTTELIVLEIKEDWAKVEYRELHPSDDYPTNDEDCYSVKKNQKTGWVKAISDTGFPNIWFSVTGY